MQPSPKPVNEAPLINVWSLASELGLIIALPLVVLVLIGIKLDKYFNTLPLFIILGMLLSFAVSAVSIARKIRRLK